MTNYQKLAEEWLENEAHEVESNFPAKYVDGFFYGARSFAIYLDIIIEEKKECESCKLDKAFLEANEYKRPNMSALPHTCKPKKIEPLMMKAPKTDWEGELLNMDFHYFIKGTGFGDVSPLKEKLKSFISSILLQEREKLREKIEGMKLCKDANDGKATPIELDNDYNQALDDLLKSL